MTANRLSWTLDSLIKLSGNFKRYVIDERPTIDREDKNYIYFLIAEVKVVYVGQANNGF